MTGVLKYDKMLTKIWKSPNFRRYLSRSAFLKDSNKPVTQQTQTSTPTSTNVQNEFSLRNEVNPTDWEKWQLVFSKRYKTKEEIPPKVPIETLVRAKSLVRIKLANVVIALTLISCVIAVVLGKKSAKEGDSLVKRELLKQEKIRSKAREDLLKGD